MYKLWKSIKSFPQEFSTALWISLWYCGKNFVWVWV